MVRRRLLFVTDIKLLPLDRGQRVRVANLLAGCTRDFAVTLVGPPPDSAADRATVERQCERVVWLGSIAPTGVAGKLITWWGALRAAPGIRRRETVKSYLPMVAALRTLDLKSFDLIWAERPHVARALASERTRTIIDLDDIEHRRMSQARLYETHEGLRGFVEAAYRSALYRWMELSWSRGFLATVVCSDSDLEYMQSQGLRNVVVIPNGVNEDSAPAVLTIRRRAAGGPLRLVFLGNIGHSPNLDAIANFVENILPRLRAEAPDTIFDVLGRASTAEIRARFAGSANFRGFVPDLAAALAGYDILVAPIRYGSGTRVKLLDAMACGIPIVTTPMGAEGLPVVDGEHLLLAEGPDQFVRKVLLLKRDPALGERLALGGMALVERRFRSSVIQEEVARCLKQLVV